MKTIYINEFDFYEYDGAKKITHNDLYNKLLDEEVKTGDTLHLLVEEKKLYCNVLVEDINYYEQVIYVKYLGDNE